MQEMRKVYRIGSIQVPALQDVSLEVFKGEMVSIMGPSGSGKSTLMNILGCLDKPTSGIYELDSINVGTLSDDRLAEIRGRKIGFVFQSYNLLSRSSALSNVELPLVYADGRQRRRRAMEALERVGLQRRMSHKPSEMSGGEQQRVAIARALVNNPSIILADEPTGNLDSKTSLEIMAILQSLNREDGRTIVIVTHDRNIAGYTQRIIHLLDGRVEREEQIAPPAIPSPGNRGRV